MEEVGEGGRAEKKKDTVVVGRRGGNGDNNVEDAHASGTGDDGSVVYSRHLLRGGNFSAQHSPEAMISGAIAFVGAAFTAVVSVGDLGGGAIVGGGIVVPVGGEQIPRPRLVSRLRYLALIRVTVQPLQMEGLWLQLSS